MLLPSAGHLLELNSDFDILCYNNPRQRYHAKLVTLFGPSKAHYLISIGSRTNLRLHPGDLVLFWWQVDRLWLWKAFILQLSNTQSEKKTADVLWHYSSNVPKVTEICRIARKDTKKHICLLYDFIIWQYNNVIARSPFYPNWEEERREYVWWCWIEMRTGRFAQCPEAGLPSEPVANGIPPPPRASYEHQLLASAHVDKQNRLKENTSAQMHTDF